jgi:DNA-binding LytR/AlgR family response regulator
MELMDVTARGISVLAVDDEAPSLDELSYLLERSELVAHVAVARSATDALRHLRDAAFDVVLLDIRMPGLDGMELARVLARFSTPPAVIFVTAHEDHALEAFEVGASGYLLKPVDATRLERVLRRALPAALAPTGVTPTGVTPTGVTPAGVTPAGLTPGPVATAPVAPASVAAPGGPAQASGHGGPGAPGVVAVDTGNRTLLVAVEDIAWVESAGDYVRLHLYEGSSHLLGTSMAVLEEEWADRGFVRIHRSYLVALHAISELRTDGAHTSVQVRGASLPVSRRHVHELRDRLVRHVRPTGR